MRVALTADETLKMAAMQMAVDIARANVKVDTDLMTIAQRAYDFMKTPLEFK